MKARGFITGHHTRHSKQFIEVRDNLWKVDELDQTDPCSQVTSGMSNPSARLKGIFNWPFLIALPSHIAATDSDNNDSQFVGQLPPSYSAGDYHAEIAYELVVTVKMKHSLL